MKSDMDKIEEILSRGVEKVIEKDHLEKRLRDGEKLRIKYGADPTAPDLHLGHAVVFRKLKEFQDLGHQIIFIIGDFTAKIGDPSGKLSARKPLTEKDIKKNVKTYETQLKKFLDIEKTEIVYNSKHLSKMSFAEIYRISHFFSVNQLLERDMFQERRKIGRPVWMHEFFYPIFQAYDSVSVKADVEIGGNDQLFNMMMGRQLQPHFEQAPQDIITMKILTGLDGTKKMSKSLGNYIGITEAPDSQYGKIMSIPDKLIAEYFALLTDFPDEEIKKMESDMAGNKMNPRDIKMKLAYEIVKIYHNENEAEKAQENFITLFQKKEIPERIPEIKTKQGNFLSDVLAENKIVFSKSEFRRLIREGAIDVEAEVLKDANYLIEKPVSVKIGKKKFVKIILE